MRTFVAIIGLLASVAGIYVFVTGDTLAPSLFGQKENVWNARLSGTWREANPDDGLPWVMEVTASGTEIDGEIFRGGRDAELGAHDWWGFIGETRGPTATVSVVQQSNGRTIGQDFDLELSNEKLVFDWPEPGTVFERE